MALNDILPYSSPMGGTVAVEWVEINSATGIVRGHPVGIDATAGGLDICATDPARAAVLGIAAGPASYTRNGVASTLNPLTGANFAAGDKLPVWVASPHQLWITKNYTTAGSAFNDTAPVQAAIGAEGSLKLISGAWGISDVAGNGTVRVVDIIDWPSGKSIQGSAQIAGPAASTTTVNGQVTYRVVFKIVGHLNANTAAVTPAA